MTIKEIQQSLEEIANAIAQIPLVHADSVKRDQSIEKLKRIYAELRIYAESNVVNVPTLPSTEDQIKDLTSVG